MVRARTAVNQRNFNKFNIFGKRVRIHHVQHKSVRTDIVYLSLQFVVVLVLR